MFGIILANTENLSEAERTRYREVYCGICHSLKARHGQSSRMCVNYDMVLLALLRESLLEDQKLASNERCLLHPVKAHAYAEGPEIDYAADVSVALAYHKCLDDWADDGRRVAKAYSSALKRSYERVKIAHPALCATLEHELRAIGEMEADCMALASRDGATQSDAAQNGGAQDNASRDAATQIVAAQNGGAQDNASRDGATQNVAAHDNATPEGAVQINAAQNGAVQDNASRDGATQNAAVQDNASRDDALPGGAVFNNAESDRVACDSAAQNADASTGGMPTATNSDALMAIADGIAKRFGATMAIAYSDGCGYWSRDLAIFGAELGRAIYYMDAALDREEDAKTGSYNPFNLCHTGDEEVEALLLNLFGRAADVFERLPLERDLNLMRNILYAGVWQRLQAQTHADDGEEVA